jgi:hypothetical protein
LWFRASFSLLTSTSVRLLRLSSFAAFSKFNLVEQLLLHLFARVPCHLKWLVCQQWVQCQPLAEGHEVSEHGWCTHVWVAWPTCTCLCHRCETHEAVVSCPGMLHILALQDCRRRKHILQSSCCAPNLHELWSSCILDTVTA